MNAVIFLLGGGLMTVAWNCPMLIISRLIVGFSSGLSSVVVPVYLGEIAPPSLRGTLGTCTQFALVIGILASDILAFSLATPTRYMWLFAVTPLLATAQLALSSFILESPRWLLCVDRRSEAARECIRKLRGYQDEADVQAEIDNFLCASDKHRTNRYSAHSGGAVWDLLHVRELRSLVVAAVVLQMAQQLCGINAVFYYSNAIFTGMIRSPLVGTTIVAAVNVVATYVALQVMDTTPRRSLLLISAGGMLLSAAVIMASLLGLVYAPIAVWAVLSFVAFFELGLGPIPWLIVAEMFDAK